MTRVRNPEATRMLRDVCRSIFDDMIVDPSVRILDIGVERILKGRFDSNDIRTCYIVTVRTNNASVVRGDIELFKGSYKERVEGALTYLRPDKGIRPDVHLEIVGPNPPTIESVHPIERLVKAGVLEADSPLATTARSYAIPHALLRGRHLVGPSPAVARVVRQVVTEWNGRMETVLDLFAGSGIATKVACAHGQPTRLIAVDSDPGKIAKLRDHVDDPRVDIRVGDACQFEIPESVDLVIADPYYEEALRFLDAQVPRLKTRAKTLLLVSGGVENLRWNRAVRSKLRQAGLSVRKHHAFGQVLFECRLRA